MEIVPNLYFNLIIIPIYIGTLRAIYIMEAINLIILRGVGLGYVYCNNDTAQRFSGDFYYRGSNSFDRTCCGFVCEYFPGGYFNTGNDTDLHPKNSGLFYCFACGRAVDDTDGGFICQELNKKYT
jgi:hypothetical protein